MDSILHYQIASELGRGKNGPTYSAVDTGLQRAVVLKVLEQQRDAAWRGQFRDLMERCSGNGDRSLARFYSLEETEGKVIAVREYIEGQSLAELVASGPLDYERFLNITFGLVKALRGLHDRLIVHGNLTAENVLIDDSGYVHIVDLGLGEGVEPTAKELQCFSPERLAGAPAGESDDLYALGVLLHLLIVGSYPHTADTAEELRHRICSDSLSFTPESGKTVPGVARLLISKLMAREPSDRFSSSDELIHTVQAMVSLGSGPSVELVEAKGWTARQYLAVSVLVLLLVILWLVVTLPSK